MRVIRKYRKKPVVIEALQWDGINLSEVTAFLQSGGQDVVRIDFKEPQKPIIKIETLEGIMDASVGDYIIRGISGEFYPCKPDIFGKTYEEVAKYPVGDTREAVMCEKEVGET